MSRRAENLRRKRQRKGAGWGADGACGWTGAEPDGAAGQHQKGFSEIRHAFCE